VILKRKISAIEELFDSDNEEPVVTKEEPPLNIESRAHMEVELNRNYHGQNLYANPLDFYKTNKDSFQNIAQLATKYLCVPGSSEQCSI
jgi:hypothetical protein